MFEHGIEVRGPAIGNSQLSFNSKTGDIESDCYHIADLMKDTCAGKLAGPFKISDEIKQVCIHITESKCYFNPLVLCKRHCVRKDKTQQSKGRRIADLTANGINGLQDPDIVPVNNLPSFDFLMALLADKDFFLDFDYAAAYRNIRISCQNWGLISYLYDNFVFIELSLPFGLVQAAYYMQT